MPSESDRVVVHPRVIATIAAMTAASVPGVVRMQEGIVERVFRLLRGRRAPGVELTIEGRAVSLDLRLVADSGFSLLDVSRRVQDNVSRAITEMTNMQVRQVSVQVEDVQASRLA